MNDKQHRSSTPHAMELSEEDIESLASRALESYLTSQGSDPNAISSFIKPISDLYASHSTSSPNIELVQDSKIEQILEILWDVLIQRAELTPHDSDAQGLVSFLAEVKASPPPAIPAPKVWGMELWEELPTFGATMREKWNRGMEGENETHTWTNINAFAARLTAAKVADFSLYGIWALRAAFETPFEDIPPTARKDNPPPTARKDHNPLIADAQRDEIIRAAAVWLLLCGNELHDREHIWEGEVARGGELYTGPKGICQERWDVWMGRIRELGSDERVRRETRQILELTRKKIELG